MSSLGALFKGRKTTPSKKTYDDLEVAVSSIKKKTPSKLLVPTGSSPFADVSASGTPMEQASPRGEASDSTMIELQRLPSMAHLPPLNRSFSTPAHGLPQIDGTELGLKFPSPVAGEGIEPRMIQGLGSTPILVGSKSAIPTRTYIDLQHSLPHSPLTQSSPRGVLSTSTSIRTPTLARDDTIDNLVGRYGEDTAAEATPFHPPIIGRATTGYFDPSNRSQAADTSVSQQTSLQHQVADNAVQFFNEDYQRAIGRGRYAEEHLIGRHLSDEQSHFVGTGREVSPYASQVATVHVDTTTPAFSSESKSQDRLTFSQGWSGTLSDISRGVVVDGEYSREMSDTELKEAISEAETSMNSVAGSIQTLSSAHISTSNGRLRLLAPAKSRPGTPPGLFGRNQDVLIPQAQVITRPTLQRFTSAAGIRSSSRLGRAVGAGVDNDWATEYTDDQSGPLTVNTVAGSSLADNSDVGSLSGATEDTQIHAFRSKKHPRYNAAWMLQRNVRTGSLSIVPIHHVQRPGDRSQDILGANDYKHPSELTFPHTNPFRAPRLDHRGPAAPRTSLMRPAEENQANKNTSERDAKSTSVQTADFPYDDEAYQWTNSDDRWEVAVDEVEGQMGQAHIVPESSAWMSTVDEAASDDVSLSQQTRTGSLDRINYLGTQVFVVRTPERTQARQVGSSLADESSPYVEASTTPGGCPTCSRNISPDSEPLSEAQEAPEMPEAGGSAFAAFARGLDRRQTLIPSSVYASPILRNQLRTSLTPRSTTRRRRHSQRTPPHGTAASPRSVRRHSKSYPAPYSRAASQDGCYIQSTPLLMDSSSSVNLGQGSPSAVKEAHGVAVPRRAKLEDRRGISRVKECDSINWMEDGAVQSFARIATPLRRDSCDPYGLDPGSHPEVTFPTEPRASKAPYSRSKYPSVKSRDQLEQLRQSTARADSPHLYMPSYSRARGSARREASLSILPAALCCIFIVPALFYGVGLLDWMMGWMSGHEFKQFRRREKNICLTWFAAAAIAAALGPSLWYKFNA